MASHVKGYSGEVYTPRSPRIVRRALLSDLPAILEVIEAARARMKAMKLPQWQNGEGPSETRLREDIRRREAFLLLLPPVKKPQQPAATDDAGVTTTTQRFVVAAVGTLTSVYEPSYEANKSIFIPDVRPDAAAIRRDGEAPYVSIHRFAVRAEYRGCGVASYFMRVLIALGRLRGFNDVRVDTHPQNTDMRRLIASCGFEERGLVIIPGIRNPERIAYQVDMRERGSSAPPPWPFKHGSLECSRL